MTEELQSKHTISILIENEFGALARVSGLFSGRGYNIESLTVAPTIDKKISRMTINAIGTDHVIEQIIKQLNKLVNIVKVKNITKEDPVALNMALIKINLSKRNKEKIRQVMKEHDFRVMSADEKSSLLRVVAEDEELLEILEKLKPYGVMEYVSTGTVAIQTLKKM